VREHASTVRDHLLDRGNKPPTVRRRMNTIVSVFNTVLNEFDLSNQRNPFAKLKIRGDTTEVIRRPPFTIKELKRIAEDCRERDDELKHIAAMQMDTGARLEEIVGLRLDDVVLDEKFPHIRIRENIKLGRTLKNPQSSRDVPLVGEALWGAREAMQARRNGEGGWLFPRLCIGRKN
jgi:integrase